MSDLNALVHNYIASKFSERINEANKVKYKLTVAIGRKLLGNNGLLDGIIYPTIQMRGNADNIVLSKEAADRTLRFVSVEYLEVVEAKDFSYGVNCLDSATRIDLIGTIHWSGRQLQWKLKSKGDELKMLSNGIEWIAYDPMGRRVDPE